MSDIRRVSVIDTHTGGEPTRVVMSGGPNLGNGPLAERVQSFRQRHDAFRSRIWRAGSLRTGSGWMA